MFGFGQIPSGYRRMLDRELIPAYVAWAKQIESQTYPDHYGEIFHTTINGVPIAGIVEHHSYTYKDGQLVPGSYHGVSLLWPPPNIQPATPAPATPVTYTPHGAPAPQGRTALDYLLITVTVFGTAVAATVAIMQMRRLRAKDAYARENGGKCPCENEE